MSLDPCTPTSAHTVVPTTSHHHPVSHRIGIRHLHRLRHGHVAGPTASEPAYGCGKHFTEDQSQPGSLAARPSGGGQAFAAAKGKAAAAKLAAAGVSLIGAAALAGALAMPAGFGPVATAGYVARGDSQPSVVQAASRQDTPGPENYPSSAVNPLMPGLDEPAPALSVPVVSPTLEQAPTPVPEPSSLALLGGFATVTLTARIFRRAAWKKARRS